MAASKHITPGEIFGHLTIIGESPKREGNPNRRALAQCECGSIKDYGMAMLRCGNTKSCGCLNGVNIAPEIGARYGKLEVIGPFSSNVKGRKTVFCRCDCGNSVNVRIIFLHRGQTTSCGCRRVEAGREKATHGCSDTRTYASWGSMRDRCTNPKNAKWLYYGGRGIKVCSRWDSFENFLCDMGDAPNGKTLDRFPDQNGDYEPNNCRWATPKQQANNTRRNRMIEYLGETMTLSQWADRIGFSQDVLHDRISRGWSINRALTQPIRVSPKH